MKRKVPIILLVLVLLSSFGLASSLSAAVLTETKLTASDGVAGDCFSHSVSVNGDTVVVGAQGTDDNGSGSGSVYVFKRDQGGPNNWGEVTKITPSDGAAGDLFGSEVSISGDILVVGAPWDDDNGTDSGSAYVFKRDQGGPNNWGEVTKITPSDGAAGDWFGYWNCLSISGDTIAIGSRYDSDNGYRSGSAYVFERDQGGPSNWGEVIKITPSDGAAWDYFGQGISISGDTLVVGCLGDDDNGEGTGSAYVFERNQGGPNNWGQVVKLTASDSAAGDKFGVSTSISGDTIVVGAYEDDDSHVQLGVGSAYVFERNQGGPNNWGEVAKLTASDGAPYDYFGVDVSISGDTIVGGAYDESYPNIGQAYVFERNQGGPNNWGEVTKLTPSDGAIGDCFGLSVSISGSIIVASAHSNDENGSDAGAAYVYYSSQPPVVEFSIKHMFIDFDCQPNKDDISIRATFSLQEGATYDLSVDDVSVSIDGVDITIPAGSFRQLRLRRGVGQGERYIYAYTSPRHVRPQIDMMLNFDRGEWSLRVQDIDASVIDNSDGVDVTFAIGSMSASEHINMWVERLSYGAEP